VPQGDIELMVSRTNRPDESKRLILRRIVVRFSFYILIFFICWSLDIVTNLISMVDENCSIYAFFFVYTFFRNLQVRLPTTLHYARRLLAGTLISFALCRHKRAS